MVVGISLRHYKIYNNVNFIPVTADRKNRLSLFIGDNGVGKSSVLEILNTFFNNGYWNRTKNEKQDQTFICPIFLIKRNPINKFLGLNDADKAVLTTVSEFLFSLDDSTNKEFREFVNIRNTFSINKDDYYLVIVGITYKERNKTYFGSSFDNELRDKIREVEPGYDVDRILHHFRRLYTYIYIPVETKSEDILRLEAVEMQKLMNKNILETIEGVLKEKKFKVPERKVHTDLVSIVNSTLNNFMEEINDHIRLIDNDYSFKVEDGFKKNLTAGDLREHILRAYFSIRTLKKSGKEIFELSSGEQRIALIDIATAFLSKYSSNKNFVIFAIDEPEASLHVSKCFKQFKRIEELSGQTNTQILLTTHWYGSIPTLSNGTLNVIQAGQKVDISTFSINNYLEKRRDFPDDIDLKSFFELVSTIISSIKSERTKWLIVEGSDDRLYYTKYLSKEVDNLIILPVGGCGNVIKIFEYLFAPFTEKIEKGILNDSKVLCLIDSDVDQKITRLFDTKIEKNLKLMRIQNHAGNSSLHRLSSQGTYFPTAIEDCLDPDFFYKSIAYVIEKSRDSSLKEDFSLFEFDTSAKSSRIDSEFSIIKPKSLAALQRKSTLVARVSSSSFKMQIAERYCAIIEDSDEETPELFNIVKDFFTIT